MSFLTSQCGCHMSELHGRRREQEQNSVCFYAWRQYTRQHTRKTRLAAQHMQQLQQSILHSMVSDWHQRCVKQKACRNKIQRCRNACVTRMLQRSLEAFLAMVHVSKEQDAAVLELHQETQVGPDVDYPANTPAWCFASLLLLCRQKLLQQHIHVDMTAVGS